VAPDIAALDKPLGVRCIHLAEDCTCRVYEARPDACRAYEADALCDDIDAPTLDARVAKYLAIFGLTEEARESARATSMRAARRLPLLPPVKTP
jgi:Fe-S-cluster containining protein